MTTTPVVPPAVDNTSRSRMITGAVLIWAIALAQFIIHFYFNNRYGYFRDEFDYIACGKHLAWGYVDQPPLVPFLTRIFLTIFGESLRSVRLLPAIVSSLLIVQAAMIVRELGGKTYAMVLTAAAILVSPQFLSNGSLLTTNCLEPNLWMACAYFIILAIKRNQPRYWLWVGIFAGLGLEEKYSIAFFVIAIVAGLLLTEQRHVLLNKWIWIGTAAGFLIFLPNFIWNVHYDWPFLQLMHNIRDEHRDVVLSAPQYFWQQALLIGPLALPIWIAGLLAFFFHPRLKSYRVLGWSYVICYAIFFGLHGKVYYLSPIYPMLLAAGGVVVEAALSRPRLGWLKPVVVGILLVPGVLLSPIVIPILSPEKFIAYTHYLPFKLPVMEHSHERASLPQWYADQFGWNELVSEVAVAWNQIPPADRHDCAIFAQDYGQAGAIDFLGRQYGLPASLSGHQTWWLWGPRGYSGNCVIVLDDRPSRMHELFESVQYVGRSADNPYALEREIPVYICRGAKFASMEQLWPKLKKWR